MAGGEKRVRFGLVFGVLVLLMAGKAGADFMQEAYDARGEALGPAVRKLSERFGLKPADPALVVDPGAQAMHLTCNGRLIKTYPISTATLGLGCVEGSFRTPVGAHSVKEKIGEGEKIGTWFKGRKVRGPVPIHYDGTDMAADYITTRILWLEGLEPGLNRGKNTEGKNVDSAGRFIYIHGTSEEGLIGRPASHGCIRMKNTDVIDLYERVPEGTLVEILNRPFKPG